MVHPSGLAFALALARGRSIVAVGPVGRSTRRRLSTAYFAVGVSYPGEFQKFISYSMN